MWSLFKVYNNDNDKGTGKIFIKLNNDKKLYISNIYDAPNMKNNIMSLG